MQLSAAFYTLPCAGSTHYTHKAGPEKANVYSTAWVSPLVWLGCEVHSSSLASDLTYARFPPPPPPFPKPWARATSRPRSEFESSSNSKPAPLMISLGRIQALSQCQSSQEANHLKELRSCRNAYRKEPACSLPPLNTTGWKCCRAFAAAHALSPQAWPLPAAP